MKQINITAQMLEEYSAKEYDAILEDTYFNYDSRLVAEDLQIHEIKGFLERRQDIVQGGYASYDYDEVGISTIWVTQANVKHRRAITTKGLVFIRNNSNLI